MRLKDEQIQEFSHLAVNASPQNIGIHSTLLQIPRESQTGGKKKKKTQKLWMQKNICSIYQGPSIIFLPYSSHLPGPQMWAMPHHACHHQEVWFEGVGDNSLASALKLPREGYCLTAKVRFEGETEVQGQELSVCFPAHTRENIVFTSTRLHEAGWENRLRTRRKQIQRTEANKRLLKFRLELALEL